MPSFRSCEATPPQHPGGQAHHRATDSRSDTGMDAREAAHLRAWTQGRTEGSLGQCSLVSTHTSPLPLSGLTSVVPENTSVPLSQHHLLRETPLATQSPSRLCTPWVPLRLSHRLAKVLLGARHCCGKPGGDSRKLRAPGGLYFPVRVVVTQRTCQPSGSWRLQIDTRHWKVWRQEINKLGFILTR